MASDADKMVHQAAAHLWDVVAVNIKTGKHRVLVPGQDYRNAEASMNMAILRRGADVDFYKLLPHGERK